MTELLTAAQMRAIEKSAIESGSVTGLELMERAGEGVVAAMFEEWPDLGLGAHRAVVLCGPGNNGGDGFVVARLLAKAGWEVEVFFYGDPDLLPQDAKTNHDRWGALGEVLHLGFPNAGEAVQTAFTDAARHRSDELPAKPPFVVIDALFGIGLTRPIAGLDTVMAHMDYLAQFRDLNKSRLVAVDVPSGYDADTRQPIRDRRPGGNPFPVIHSDLVVTFHARKPVHDAIENNAVRVVVRDIGLGPFSDLKKSPPEAQNR